MQFRLFKLRFRRRLRKAERQVEDFSQQAETGIEKLFFRRLSRLGPVWRFVTAWIVLALLLIAAGIYQIAALGKQYQSLQPVAGGTFSEGIEGTFTNANPLFARSEVDASVSRLLFAGLFTFDSHDKLIGDLASGYDVDDKGDVYTVHLKPGLTWQDGRPLTADDVVFTYQTLQNPDVQSPLITSWRNVTVAKKDASTVTFTLASPLSSFPYSMTNGIVPQHLLAAIPPADLRSADFNTLHPVGAGPFAWSALQVKRSADTINEISIALKPFAGYTRGAPKLASYVVDCYAQQAAMLASFKAGQLNAVAGLNETPSWLPSRPQYQQYNLELTAATMAFFNNTNPVLSDGKVRQALVQSVDTTSIIGRVGYPTAAVNEPFLGSQIGYDKAYRQLPYNVTAAQQLLDGDGWQKGVDGVRRKANQPLSFTLEAPNTQENSQLAGELQQYWKAVGADVTVHLDDSTGMASVLQSQSYDALLYAISIGVDPDVYVYWHSSQIDPRSSRLNLSLYKSSTTDASLEAGRTRLDPQLRAIKYRPFLQAWQQNAPALGLYQPRFLYLSDEKLYGLDAHLINTGTDRYNNVQNWMVRTARVTDN